MTRSARGRLLGLVGITALALVVSISACGARSPQGTAEPTATTSSASPQPTPSFVLRAAHIIDDRYGWALSDSALSATTDDGATWTTITPPNVPAMTIRGVYFLDAKHGWAVSALDSNPSQLQISATADGGSTWTTSALGNPDGLFSDSEFIPAYVDFVDAQHGWVVAMIASSAGVQPRGALFHTSDGGATWDEFQMPLGGKIEFVSSSVGWLADGQQGSPLYVTSDGGKTWNTATVTPPNGFTSDQAAYTIPDFTTGTNVILVTFGSDNQAAGFYQTADNGATWQLAATVPAAIANPSTTLASAAQWFAVAIDGKATAEFSNDGSSQTTTTSSGLPVGAGYGNASFTGDGHGWIASDMQKCAALKTACTEVMALYVTTDAGADWQQVTVP